MRQQTETLATLPQRPRDGAVWRGLLFALVAAVRDALRTGGVTEGLLVAVVGLLVLFALAALVSAAQVVAAVKVADRVLAWQSEEGAVVPVPQ